MSVAILWLRSGGWKIIAVVALVLAFVAGAYRYGAQRYEAGEQHERTTWAAATAKAAVTAAALAVERDAAVTKADTADAYAKRSIDALATRGRDTVKEYYRANPAANVECLPAVRLRSIADSDRAALAAATTPGAGDAAVHDPGADRR